jgi:hypothetical protein
LTGRVLLVLHPAGSTRMLWQTAIVRRLPTARLGCHDLASPSAPSVLAKSPHAPDADTHCIGSATSDLISSCAPLSARAETRGRTHLPTAGSSPASRTSSTGGGDVVPQRSAGDGVRPTRAGEHAEGDSERRNDSPTLALGFPSYHFRGHRGAATIQHEWPRDACRAPHCGMVCAAA